MLLWHTVYSRRAVHNAEVKISSGCVCEQLLTFIWWWQQLSCWDLSWSQFPCLWIITAERYCMLLLDDITVEWKSWERELVKWNCSTFLHTGASRFEQVGQMQSTLVLEGVLEKTIWTSLFAALDKCFSCMSHDHVFTSKRYRYSLALLSVTVTIKLRHHLFVVRFWLKLFSFREDLMQAFEKPWCNVLQKGSLYN